MEASNWLNVRRPSEPHRYGIQHKLGYAFYEGLGIPSLIPMSFSLLLTSNSSYSYSYPVCISFLSESLPKPVQLFFLSSFLVTTLDFRFNTKLFSFWNLQPLTNSLVYSVTWSYGIGPGWPQVVKRHSDSA